MGQYSKKRRDGPGGAAGGTRRRGGGNQPFTYFGPNIWYTMTSSAAATNTEE